MLFHMLIIFGVFIDPKIAAAINTRVLMHFGELVVGITAGFVEEFLKIFSALLLYYMFKNSINAPAVLYGIAIASLFAMYEGLMVYYNTFDTLTLRIITHTLYTGVYFEIVHSRNKHPLMGYLASALLHALYNTRAYLITVGGT
ncbi:PrsW family glutamic-type intramembrane protease [Thermococcus paralvinellae]|nr:PrsW family glutamic-type intramembrane protease [Thermococcus paralvinellae]